MCYDDSRAKWFVRWPGKRAGITYDSGHLQGLVVKVVWSDESERNAFPVCESDQVGGYWRNCHCWRRRRRTTWDVAEEWKLTTPEHSIHIVWLTNVMHRVRSPDKCTQDWFPHYSYLSARAQRTTLRPLLIWFKLLIILKGVLF